VLRHARRGLRAALAKASARLLFWPKAWRWRLLGGHPKRLHLGCGRNRFEGWINADTSASSELIVFMERPLPLPDACLSRIYSEHVLEHVSYDVGLTFLREAFRVLEPGGVIRVAVPDLEDLVEGYVNSDWKTRFDWTQWPEYGFLKTRAQMLNIGFRWWGHQHLYDREELERVFLEAGYRNLCFPAHGESLHEDLRSLETRVDSRLILEAMKDTAC
jgi:predicted SAM-dependent methyltransferase